MFNDEDLLEASRPAISGDQAGDRRRPGRLEFVAPALLPLLRDPGAIVAADEPTTMPRALALIAVCACVGIGYLMRGMP